jgi:hypothetical protein
VSRPQGSTVQPDSNDMNLTLASLWSPIALITQLHPVTVATDVPQNLNDTEMASLRSSPSSGFGSMLPGLARRLAVIDSLLK